jgi:hypothetical protein
MPGHSSSAQSSAEMQELGCLLNLPENEFDSVPVRFCKARTHAKDKHVHFIAAQGVFYLCYLGILKGCASVLKV